MCTVEKGGASNYLCEAAGPDNGWLRTEAVLPTQYTPVNYLALPIQSAN
jgi:hypothetical protein